MPLYTVFILRAAITALQIAPSAVRLYAWTSLLLGISLGLSNHYYRTTRYSTVNATVGLDWFDCRLRLLSLPISLAKDSVCGAHAQCMCLCTLPFRPLPTC